MNPKSGRSRPQSVRFLPTPRDRLILLAVSTHGRLTREHVRRLFFRTSSGLASPQAVNARLRSLVDAGFLRPTVVTTPHGSGPYAYAPTSQARSLLRLTGRARASVDAVWHDLEVADFRVALELALQRLEGELVEWQGEQALRRMLVPTGTRVIPDALVHWHLARREGTFLLEWDRGSETLSVLTSKLARYRGFLRVRRHRELLPGLGLRPRLAIVVSSAARHDQLRRWLQDRWIRDAPTTVVLGEASRVRMHPLAPVWWRSDVGLPGHLVEQP